MCNENNNETLIQQEQRQAREYKSGLDLEKDGNLVLLTPENAAKIGARILLNPRYERTLDETNENSTRFFINQLKEGQMLYNKDNIETIIRRINSENSTRMSDGEMVEIAHRIVGLATTKEELITFLKNKDYSLIDAIAKNIKTQTKGKKERNRVNFSFATKFYHYMSFYLFEGEKEYQDNYSIYDNIVIDIIPDYASFFNIECELKPFNKKRAILPSEYYKKYQDLIGDILKKNGNRITRNAFDHIMWYYTKTKKDENPMNANDDQTAE